MVDLGPGDRNQSTVKGILKQMSLVKEQDTPRKKVSPFVTEFKKKKRKENLQTQSSLRQKAEFALRLKCLPIDYKERKICKSRDLKLALMSKGLRAMMTGVREGCCLTEPENRKFGKCRYDFIVTQERVQAIPAGCSPSLDRAESRQFIHLSEPERKSLNTPHAPCCHSAFTKQISDLSFVYESRLMSTYYVPGPVYYTSCILSYSTPHNRR